MSTWAVITLGSGALGPFFVKPLLHGLEEDDKYYITWAVSTLGSEHWALFFVKPLLHGLGDGVEDKSERIQVD
jgi:hypothetical protein